MEKKAVAILFIVLSAIFCISPNGLAIQKAVTEDGKIVVLNPDGTWRYIGSKEIAYEDIVKSGRLKLDPSVNVGEALNRYQYFVHTEWKSFEDSQKRQLVEFNGIFDYDKFSDTIIDGLSSTFLTAEKIRKAKEKSQGLKVAYVAQFAISADGESFDLKYSGLKTFGANQDASEEVKSMQKERADEGLKLFRNIYSNKLDPSIWGFFLYLSEIKTEPKAESKTKPSGDTDAENILKKQWGVTKTLAAGSDVVFFFFSEKCKSAEGELRRAEIRGSAGEDDPSGTGKLLEEGCWKSDSSSKQIIYVNPQSKITPLIQGFKGNISWQELFDLEMAN